MNKYLDPKLSLEAFQISLLYLYGCQFDLDDSSSDLIQLLRLAKITTESLFNKFLAILRETLIEKFGFNELKKQTEPKLVSNKLSAARFDPNRDADEKTQVLADCLAKILNSACKEKQISFNPISHVYMQDCQITCNSNQEINAHKCILIARSV